ncbi:MAG: hypothetical protein N3F03_07950 [Ignavibacteria bacterium]|nr:hypothetical protein [Ignavibacteria bacterium]
MSEKKQKISPEKYQKILEGLELVSISLKDAKCYLNTDVKFPGELGVTISSDEKFKVISNDEIQIVQKYSLDARKRNSKSRFLNVEATFLVKLKSKENFTEDFFNVYKEISLKLNTWPYFREFINNITLRMNIPPLTLPLFKVK